MEEAVMDNNCKDCMRISCKKCDWVASQEEVFKIQNKKLTACTQCGWQPK